MTQHERLVFHLKGRWIQYRWSWRFSNHRDLMETLKGRINEVMGIYAVPEEEVLQEDDDLE